MTQRNTLDGLQEIVHHTRALPAKRVAITGGIACGKSALARCLQDQGFDVIDADDIVHRLESPGGGAVKPIADAFGSAVIAADGGVDRSALGGLVFGNAGKLRTLNAIVHPMVRVELGNWFHEREKFPCFAVIPLLFETGWHGQWDCVVCVACQADEQMRRLRGRGLGEEAARQRLAAQWPVAEKARRADHVIWNDGTMEALRAEAGRLVKKLLGSES